LGGYELAYLPVKDRIGFTREFWLTKLPYHPNLDGFLTQFFLSLDNVGVFLTERTFQDPFEAYLVYSLTDNHGFFHEEPPAGESKLIELQKEFSNYTLSGDDLAFFQIHHGFAKLTETGITPST